MVCMMDPALWEKFSYRVTLHLAREAAKLDQKRLSGR